MKMDSKKKASPAWLGLSVWVVFLLMIGGSVFLYKKSPPHRAAFNHYYTNVTTWLAERKQNWHKNLKQVNPIAEPQKEAAPEIRFDFYTTLEDLQVPAAQIKAELPQEKKAPITQVKAEPPKERKAPITQAKADIPKEKKALIAQIKAELPKEKKTPIAETKRPMFDPREIEQSLSTQITQRTPHGHS